MLSDCAISGHMVNVQPKQQQLKNATNQPTNQLKHDELLYTSPKQTKGRNKKKATTTKCEEFVYDMVQRIIMTENEEHQQ